jgi:hypothetical protein
LTLARIVRLIAKSLRLTAAAAEASSAITPASSARRMIDCETNAASDVVTTATSTTGMTIRW